MRRPELRGRPVVVAGSGPRAVVTTASYEARRYGVFSAIPAARARRLCPEATFIAPDREAYIAMSKRVMGRVRAQVDTVEVAGLDEAYLDLSGIIVAARGDAPPDLRDQGRHRPALLRRDRPEPARGQGRLRRREARGLRHAHARAGVRALRGRRAAAAARDRRQDRRAARGARDRDDRAARGDAAGDAGRALRRPPRARTCAPARASRTTARSPPSASRSPSRARPRSRPTSPTAREQVAVLRRLAGRALRGPGQARAARAHDRDQGAPRRLHDRHPRPHAAGSDQRRRRSSRTSRARCWTSTRRRGRCGCSGVRVAAFDEEAVEGDGPR